MESRLAASRACLSRTCVACARAATTSISRLDWAGWVGCVRKQDTNPCPSRARTDLRMGRLCAKRDMNPCPLELGAWISHTDAGSELLRAALCLESRLGRRINARHLGANAAGYAGVALRLSRCARSIRIACQEGGRLAAYQGLCARACMA